MAKQSSKSKSSKKRTDRQSLKNIALAVHGGAGVMTRASMSEANEKRYLKHLEGALKAGYQALKEHGSSLDAVEEAVRYLEDCPMFNAGRGSVFTHEGKNELDAAIMDGCDCMAGAVAAITNIKNPITAARAVMEQSPHVLMVGKGAEQFARKFGLEMIDPAYFHTDHQWKHLQQVLVEAEEEEQQALLRARNGAKSSNAHAESNGGGKNEKTATAARVGKVQSAAKVRVSTKDKAARLKKFGTVGAVAVDEDGNLAAATSTGGTVNKQYGRVGDSPLIGAGTYADNHTCAVSTTGHGEYFIRYVAAYDVSALMKYAKLSLPEAANHVVHETLLKAGGEGGLIAIDRKGNCALPFNSEGMFRGCISKKGEVHLGIYGD